MSQKAAWFDALRQVLQGQLDEVLAARASLSDGLRVDGAHRPANRGERAAVTSAGYLAHGLGERQAELEAALDLLERTPPSPRDRAVTGAVVTVEDGRRWLLFPGASGIELDGIVVISPASPVGRALWGLEEDDEAELPTGAVAITGVE